ncbi:hypothetical protein U1Q18_036284, partial [Sarracenia purpurea var. burkii]
HTDGAILFPGMTLAVETNMQQEEHVPDIGELVPDMVEVIEIVRGLIVVDVVTSFVVCSFMGPQLLPLLPKP